MHCTGAATCRPCPGYPGTYSAADTCTYTLPKASSGVCRIRLDFVEATLAAPSSQGACTTDYFAGTQVRGGNELASCVYHIVWINIEYEQ